MNAYGIRHGLANLCSIMSNLEHHMGHTTIGERGLEEMLGIARVVGDAGASPAPESSTGNALLEGMDPELMAQLTENGRRALNDRIQILEIEDYDLRTAGGTLELLVRESIDPDATPFVAERFEITSHSALYGGALTTATATIRAGDAVRCESEDSDGGVNALERSLRQCLFALYPEVANLHVADYRIQVIEPAKGTASRGCVWLTWSENGDRFVTLGVSHDLLEATWRALVDGFQLHLMRRGRTAPATVDSSWAV
jgi:2-isopropylmalate synthase